MRLRISERMQRVSIISLIAILVASLALTPFSALKIANAAAIETVVPLKTIPLSAKSYIKLKQAFILSAEHSNTVSFTLTIHNGDTKDIQFLDYWVRLFTKAGAIYYPQLVTEQLNKKRIVAGTDEDFTFYVSVGAKVKLQDLIFKALKWDFKEPSFTKIVGEISLPANYTLAVKWNAQQKLEGNDTVFSAKMIKTSQQKKEDTLLATLLYSIENIGLKSAALPNYEYSILTADGIEYSLEVSGLSPGEQLLPKIVKELELSGILPAKVKLSQSKLLIKTTETASKLILPIALFELAATNSEDPTLVVVDKGTILIDKQTVTASVYEVTQTLNDEATQPLIEEGYLTELLFNFENTGSKKVTIPNYQFLLRTEDGLSYPLSTSDLTNLVINPKQKKQIKLSVTIPLDVNMGQMKLEIYEPLVSGAEAAKNKRIGTYSLPQNTASINITANMGQPVSYTNDSGVYALSLNSLQRLPWQDQDQMMAEISLQNSSSSSLPIPEITGYYLLDDLVKVEARIVQPEQGIAISGNSAKSLIVLGNLPYSQQFESLQLILQVAGVDHSKITIAEFSGTSEYMKLNVVEAEEAYEITDSGRKAKLNLHKVSTYTNASSDLVYAELQMQNTEKRFSHLARLNGYYKTADDRYYPAAISNVEQSVSPDGSDLISFWSKVPKGLKQEDLQLVIGEATTGNKTSSDGEVPNGYINPVAFQLTAGNNPAKISFTNLEISQYHAFISKIKTTIGLIPNSVGLSFNYALTKNDIPYEAVPEGHKLVIEFEAENEKYTEELELESGAGSKVLQLGSSNTYQINITDPDLFTKITTFNNYTLRIYDKFQDHSQLLADRSFKFFTDSD
ncbi:hypothetical protein EHS13_11915 [Paenibacillus psychroresistens]|uniref:Uncharacterized protein n=1 Tax=Paenibacillus psychroresistens TaxID=1778678 RepID=A0A6B8RIH3_9BACL|nr:hypothetical protein [Paenibacillus psychroresistens]QGQ95534.1 hypothetical protein EHS13_11915 [Paenibacillus psychroresistens]